MLIPVLIAILVIILYGIITRRANKQGINQDGNGGSELNDTDGNRDSYRRDCQHCGDNGSRGNDKRVDKEVGKNNMF